MPGRGCVAIWGTMKLKLSDLSIRQVSIAIPLLAVLNWAVLQFAILPNMSEEQRKQLYPGWTSSPYAYALCFIFVGFAFWFVFLYRGILANHQRRLALFAMALGSIFGMLMISGIRLFWHI